MQLRLLRQIKRRLKQNLHCGDYFAIIAFCPHSILLNELREKGELGLSTEALII